MSHEVNGFKLPAVLCKLLEDGTWTESGQQYNITSEMLSDMFDQAGISTRYSVMTASLESMRRESDMDWQRHGHKTYEEWLNQIGRLYAYDSSKYAGHKITEDHILDVDKFVVIAYNMDEDVIALDYRFNPDEPRVMATEYPDNYVPPPNPKWKEIAPNFETFARNIGFIK